MQIRPEESSDLEAVRHLNEAAFESPAEARLVDALRVRIPEMISLVAEEDGNILGHILFSPVTLTEHRDLRVMGLAPMAVQPDRQRGGLGSALVRSGLEACTAAGSGAVVVLGHPTYYPRFGFAPASRFGLRSEYEVPDEAFMALELQADFLQDASGKVCYHPAFSEVT